MKTLPTIALTLAATLALSACELRREGGEEAPDDETGEETGDPQALASPTPDASDAPIPSILREDVEEEAAAASPQPEEPAEPVEITLSFPDGPEISQAAERRLIGLLQEDAMDEDWPVILAGHTDSGGNDAANLRASRSRAEAVAAWLVERGVDNDRIEVIAFGEQNPLAPNALPDGTPNEEGRRQNRRVEITIAPPGD